MADLYISGLTGAFDTESMISSLLKIKQKPLQTLTQQKALIQTKVSSLSNLYGALNSMQNFLSSLDINKIFSTKRANSSNTNVLNATATKDTPNLTMSLTITRLAQTEMRASTKGMSLTDRFASSGTMMLTYWKDDSNSVNYSINYSSGQSLEDFVNSINSSQSDVKASIYFTGTEYRLLLTEADASKSKKETGENSSVIEVEGLPSELYNSEQGMLESLQNAQNASLRIGNSATEITSASNTFKNLVTGLDITVKETGTATVTISEDYSKVDSILNSFVSNYNGVINIINQLTGKGAQFQGDSTVTTIKTGFVRMLNPLINAGLIDYSDKDGTISIKTDVLNNLKNSNPEKLSSILTNLKNSFSTQLNAWTGAINTFKNIGEGQINSINQKISNLQNYLVKYEERLRNEYAQLEAFINQMNQISSRLQDFMTTLSEMTGGKEK